MKLVEEAFVTVSLVIVVVAKLEVEVAVNEPATRLVVVALVAVRFVKNAEIPFRRVAKKLVEVALVVDAFVAAKLPVVVLLVVVRLATVPVVE